MEEVNCVLGEDEHDGTAVREERDAYETKMEWRGDSMARCSPCSGECPTDGHRLWPGARRPTRRPGRVHSRRNHDVVPAGDGGGEQSGEGAASN